MTDPKCKQCGLVNPFNALACKRCGSSLIGEDNPDARQVAEDTTDARQIADDTPDAARIARDNRDAPRIAEDHPDPPQIAGDNPDVPQGGEEEAGKKEGEPLGFWGCMQLLIFLLIAGSITGYFGIYIMDYLPSGRYPIILLIAIFIPAAIVGSAAGGLVIYLIQLLVKAVKGEEKVKSKK